MDLLAISLVKPNGFWEAIIFGMENGVKNYALALILVTVIIKLVMVPLDFINKYSVRISQGNSKTIYKFIISKIFNSLLIFHKMLLIYSH